MEYRERTPRPGLLILFIFISLFMALPLGAQEEEPEDEGLEIQILSSPASPIAGGAWTFTILVDHPISQEVGVQPPRFPQNLILERVRTDVRNIRPPGRPEDEPSRWTAVEFLFSIRQGGSTTMGSFEVRVGSKQVSTVPITVQIRNVTTPPARSAPLFRWERLPASLALGQAEDLSLVLTNWDTQRPIPRNLLRGLIPENAIMEELPFSGDGDAINYPIRIIPLEGNNVIFGPLSVQFEGETMEIPRFSLTVVAAEIHTPLDDSESLEVLLPFDEEILFSIPFPQAQENLFFLFRNKYNRIIGEARDLWYQGRRVEALALIRKNERDSLSGPFFAPLRREMEMNLGLSFTMDEPWGIWNHQAFPWVFSVLLLLGLVIILKMKINSQGFKSIKSIKPLGVLGGLGVILLVIGLGAGIGGFGAIQSRSAVLENTEAYRVPDIAGAMQFMFDEGQPVKILSTSGPWIYAEAIDGKSGWIPIEKVYPY